MRRTLRARENHGAMRFRGFSEGPLPAPLGTVRQREGRKQARAGGGRWGDRAAEAGRDLVRPRRKAASRRREVAMSSRRRLGDTVGSL